MQETGRAGGLCANAVLYEGKTGKHCTKAIRDYASNNRVCRHGGFFFKFSFAILRKISLLKVVSVVIYVLEHAHVINVSLIDHPSTKITVKEYKLKTVMDNRFGQYFVLTFLASSSIENLFIKPCLILKESCCLLHSGTNTFPSSSSFKIV